MRISYPPCKKLCSCKQDEHISPTSGLRSREFNASVVLEFTHLCRKVTLVFTFDDVKNDVSLCKLDNVKKRLAFVGSVGFLKLELKLLQEEV